MKESEGGRGYKIMRAVKTGETWIARYENYGAITEEKADGSQKVEGA